MPSLNRTPNIGLNQWSGNEYPKRQDFTDDNVKIDAAIASRETPTGAQAKVDALAGEGNTKTVKAIADELESHRADFVSHFKEIGAVGNGQTITDFNLATKQGKYIIADVSSGVTNNPLMASWGILEVINNATTGYLHQKAYSIVDNVVYERCRNESTTWTPWRKILDQRDYDQLFQYANNGKTGIANAITAKGVTANPTDTFSVLADKIGQIITGKRWASGSTVPSSNSFTISGLAFTPSIVIGYAPLYSKADLFSVIQAIQDGVIRIYGNTHDRTSDTTSFSALYSDGFKLYITSSVAVNWIAIE